MTLSRPACFTVVVVVTIILLPSTAASAGARGICGLIPDARSWETDASDLAQAAGMLENEV